MLTLLKKVLKMALAEIKIMNKKFIDSVIEASPVFQKLVELEKATAKEIADNVDVSKRTVERELSELVYYGEITKTETSGAFEADKWHSNVTKNGRIKTISIDNLYVDPQHGRVGNNLRITDSFRDSIERHGVINPLTVREKHTESPEYTNEKGTPESPAGEQDYFIVAGKRRYAAAVEVGLPEIDCIIRDLTDEEAASLSLDSNVCREQPC